MKIKQSKAPIADRIVMLLDGMTIEDARNALKEAELVLANTQIVSAHSPLFTKSGSSTSSSSRH